MTAIPEFWLAHKSKLRAYIARRIREHDVVDDVLQNVFIKAHTSLHTVKAPGSLTAWLYRIAANAIADHYRTRKPVEALSDEMPQPEPESDHVAELASCLQPLIAELPEIYRIPLELSELKGYAQKAVASQLGLSLSGAKSRIQRGREQLRQRLLACCDIEIGKDGISGYTVREKGRSCDCE